MRRILLKLSGEALAGPAKKGLDYSTVMAVAKQVKEVAESGCEVGIVIGGGNFWRGDEHENEIERTKGDEIGMLATVMNCLYVSEVFRKAGLKTKVLTPFAVGSSAYLYSKDLAMESLEDGEIVFFAGGTGHPFFSTDTATVLRALEMEADGILMAKSVDGVYNSDPKRNPDAKKYDTISMSRVVEDGLGVIDQAAAVLAKENKMPLVVFALAEDGSILRAAQGKTSGTVVLPE